MELFAQFKQQGNDPAFQAGLIAGIIFAVIFCGSIPLILGITRGRVALGVAGGVLASGGAVLLGCLGGLPVALVFVVIILALGDPRKAKARRNEYDDDDEYEDDRPRRRHRDDEYEDDPPRRPRDQ